MMEHGVGRTGPAGIGVRLEAPTAAGGRVLLQFGLDVDVNETAGLAEGSRRTGTPAHFLLDQVLNTTVRVRGRTGRDTVRTVVQQVTGRPAEHFATGGGGRGRRRLTTGHPGSHQVLDGPAQGQVGKGIVPVNTNATNATSTTTGDSTAV